MFEDKKTILGEGQFGTVTLIRRHPPGTPKIETHNDVSRKLPQIKSRRGVALKNATVQTGQISQIREQPQDNNDDDDETSNTETISFSSYDRDSAEIRASRSQPSWFACKTLRKGVVFKDNVFYTPLSPKALQTEVDCLIALKGEHSCLRLYFAFETPKFVLLVTDLCTEGHLLEYQQKQSSHINPSCDSESLKLPVHVIASLAFQLLDAISHCAYHCIIHRDIKAQNCLISRGLSATATQRDATNTTRLTLADFGSSAIHRHHHEDGDFGVVNTCGDMPVHSTFVGSPFYRSPEMFRHSYTQKTDVWSAGVVLYVAAFGYPSGSSRRREILDFLYATSSVARNWKALISEALRDKVPCSYFELLDNLLMCNQEQRPNAREVLCSSAFLQNAGSTSPT
ncbi:hypothetical protein ACA910_009686 [Epithemia clementina (nom. ined.)]